MTDTPIQITDVDTQAAKRIIDAYEMGAGLSFMAGDKGFIARVMATHRQTAYRAGMERAAESAEKFAKGLEADYDFNVINHLSARLCCNGHDCGCRGSTVGEYLAYELRAAIRKELDQ